MSEGAPAFTLALSGAAPLEVAQLHAVLLSMAERLEQRASYVQNFASQVSHELKTPITAIRGAAELLTQADADMPEPHRARFLRNIHEDALRMERLVTRLLALAKLENTPLERAPAIEVESRVRRLLARYSDRVSVEAAPEVGMLEMGEEPLASVVLNLVENALRHGGDQPVSVRLRREMRFVQIDVHDSGPGVSEANRGRLAVGSGHRPATSRSGGAFEVKAGTVSLQVSVDAKDRCGCGHGDARQPAQQAP